MVTEALFNIDVSILFGVKNIRTPFLDAFFSMITHLGDGGWLWIILGGILLCFKEHRKTGFILLFTLAAGFLIGNLVLKNLIHRARPFELFPHIKPIINLPTDPSFPSGHTLASFETAWILFWNNKKWGIFTFILATFIAFSRIYLQVHYLTDVLGGFVLAFIIAKGINYFVEERKENYYGNQSKQL